jgi:hypothetical protein
MPNRLEMLAERGVEVGRDLSSPSTRPACRGRRSAAASEEREGVAAPPEHLPVHVRGLLRGEERDHRTRSGRGSSRAPRLGSSMPGMLPTMRVMPAVRGALTVIPCLPSSSAQVKVMPISAALAAE